MGARETGGLRPEAAEALGEAVRDLLDLPGRGKRSGGGLGKPGYDSGRGGAPQRWRHPGDPAPAAAAAPDFCGSTPGERPGARRFGDYRRGERGNCPKCGGSYAAGPGSWWWTPWRLAARTGFAG